MEYQSSIVLGFYLFIFIIILTKLGRIIVKCPRTIRSHRLLVMLSLVASLCLTNRLDRFMVDSYWCLFIDTSINFLSILDVSIFPKTRDFSTTNFDLRMF